MRHSPTQLSQREMMEFMGMSGRALRFLHDEKYEEAIDAYEQLNKAFLFPPNLLFLSRAYVAVGRIVDGICSLEKCVELEPENRQNIEELVKLKGNGRVLIIKYGVGNLLRGAPESLCGNLLRANQDLVDEEMASILHSNAMTYIDMAKFEVVRALYCLLRQIAIQHPTNHRVIGMAADVEGALEHLKGNNAKAYDLLRLAERRYIEAGDVSFSISVRNRLGLVALNLGRHEEAIEAFASTYDHLSRAENSKAAALVLENLADAYRRNGDFAKAIDTAEVAERQYSGLDMMEYSLKAKSLRAKTLADMGKARQALTIIEEVIAKGRDIWKDLPMHLADSLMTKSYLLEDMQRYESATKAAMEAKAIYQEMGIGEQFLPTHQPSGAGVKIAGHDFREAEQEMMELIREFEQSGMVLDAAREKMNLAKLYKDELVTLTQPGGDLDVGTERARVSMGNFDHAERILRECIETFARTNHAPLVIGARKQLVALLVARLHVEKDVLGLGSNNLEREKVIAAEYDALVDLAKQRDFGTASIQQNRAVFLMEMGKLDQAIQVLHAAAVEAQREDDSDCLLYIYKALGDAYKLLGSDLPALEAYKACIPLYEKLEARIEGESFLIEWSKDTAAFFDPIVDLLVEMGRHRDAYETVLKAKGRNYYHHLVRLRSPKSPASLPTVPQLCRALMMPDNQNKE